MVSGSFILVSPEVYFALWLSSILWENRPGGGKQLGSNWFSGGTTKISNDVLELYHWYNQSVHHQPAKTKEEDCYSSDCLMRNHPHHFPTTTS